MGFKSANIGGRDTRITVSKPTVAYDDDGIETISSSIDTSFWGKVMQPQDLAGDMKYSAYKRLDNRTIGIEADSRTVASISILDTLTTDQGLQSYEVIDKYDATWKFTAMIIAKHKGNG